MARIVGTVAAVLATVLLSGQAKIPRFDGVLEFTEKNCAKKEKCTLKRPFGYVDSRGIGWQAPKDQWTNGASIPKKLRARYGNPFDASLIRAAVIHDHYCDRFVRSWSDTHWVFYDALLTSGVDKSLAREMYAGLLLGGPLWVIIKKGTPCSVGETCVQQADGTPLPAGGVMKDTEDGRRVLVREARYEDPFFDAEFEELQAKLNANAGAETRSEIENLVKQVRPRDPFLTAPDTIVITPAAGGVIE